MKFVVLTLFPELVRDAVRYSVLGRGVAQGHVSVHTMDIRTFSRNKHGKVDDAPYGGGPGMVMTPEPLALAIAGARATCHRPRVVAMSPSGPLFTQARARRLAASGDDLVLVCGRYEGIDQRLLDGWVDEELSVGDVVLSGGELAALVVIDAVARLVPGVLGNAGSVEEESLENGLLEYPQYTRPEVFEGREVPPILLSGDHAKIAAWRRRESLHRTRARRDDLWRSFPLSDADKKLLES